MASDDERTSLLPAPRTNLQGRSPVPPGVSPIISESDDAITVRRPLQYYSIRQGGPPREHDERTRAQMHRYKYYSKLSAPRDLSMMMPNHIVPPEYFLVLPIRIEEGNQSSLVTIFSIWNTMMGTSILSMPWALNKAGFSMGLCVMALFAFITLYTAYRIMKSPQNAGDSSGSMEFTDVCGYYLGRWGEYLSVTFSLAALIGAAIVYWVLMSNFLYNSVKFIYEEVHGDFGNNTAIIINNKTITDGNITFGDPTTSNELISDEDQPMFYKVWTQTLSVPFFLVIILGPLMNIKSPTFFTKFNALGTVSVMYILVFVTIKAFRWGVNVEFKDPSSDIYLSQFEWTFPALSGILALAYFIHNCILSIVRNQRNPENNGRDLSIAYILVLLTYMFIGSVFCISFPLPKDCIEDNLLNNLATNDVLAFVARIFLFFQMVTVFPLLCYIFRIQVLNTLTGSNYPGFFYVLAVNAVIVTLCLIFAIFLPQIGTIIRFSGALCGCAYIFTLPCIIYILAQWNKGERVHPLIYVMHFLIILIGLANFIGQFLIIDA